MIIDYIKSLFGTVEKDQVLDHLADTRSSFSFFLKLMSGNEAEYSYKADGEIKSTYLLFSDNKHELYKKYCSDFYRYLKPKGFKKTGTLSTDLTTIFSRLLETIDAIEIELQKHLESNTVKNGITVKKAVLIRCCDELAYVAKYSYELWGFMASTLVEYMYEKNKGSLKDKIPSTVLDMSTDFNAEMVQKEVMAFVNLLNTYTMPADDFKAYLVSTPDVILNENTEASITKAYGVNKLDPLYTPLPKGFVGSPIYHIGLSIAEWQAKEYRLKKDKRVMLELRLNQIANLKNDTMDPKLDKEIQYVQNRIERLEHELHQMET